MLPRDNGSGDRGIGLGPVCFPCRKPFPSNNSVAAVRPFIYVAKERKKVRNTIPTFCAPSISCTSLSLLWRKLSAPKTSWFNFFSTFLHQGKSKLYPSPPIPSVSSLSLEKSSATQAIGTVRAERIVLQQQQSCTSFHWGKDCWKSCLWMLRFPHRTNWASVRSFITCSISSHAPCGSINKGYIYIYFCTRNALIPDFISAKNSRYYMSEDGKKCCSQQKMPCNPQKQQTMNLRMYLWWL